ncbi:uncharacterized protein Z520_03246 [Fonsecaea multimorphosa CBS 102226]|uniref:T6SS Phospholipase effector Tle1-like catalytic domain-containing protein n=1 Tax=Fonsecaea multimorphosa CBS 102226 TaxID=1442371 RepID=A0A0D2K426_9EURO|nr:uncharacterized protein Z520_03246 [Fonsecaea multimorphosa CBS 102226]KIY00583.1 hypothetical protein Z520_03246 [Fonsecaea multimorphosa CBS 102226]
MSTRPRASSTTRGAGPSGRGAPRGRGAPTTTRGRGGAGARGGSLPGTQPQPAPDPSQGAAPTGPQATDPTQGTVPTGAEPDQSSPTGRRLLIFCDGTGENGGDNSGKTSNLARLALSIGAEGTDRKEQICYYQQGLGTGKFSVSKIFQMAVGQGMAENIQNIYSALAPQAASPSQPEASTSQRAEPAQPGASSSTTEPGSPPRWQRGDTLCFFGFSRGAATARFAANFIATVGFRLEGPAATSEVGQLYETWNALKEDTDYKLPEGFEKPEIECVGVFDTVSALGITRTQQAGIRPGVATTADPLKAKGDVLNGSILSGFHALALHEMRQAFAPDLWIAQASPAQKIFQTWFIGKHSDIGGGPPQDQPNSGLANATLRWMVERIRSIGIGVAIENEELNAQLAIPESEAGQGQVRSQNPVTGTVAGGPQVQRQPGTYQKGHEAVHISVRIQGLLNTKELPQQPSLEALIGRSQPVPNSTTEFEWGRTVEGDEITMLEDTVIAPEENAPGDKERPNKVEEELPKGAEEHPHEVEEGLLHDLLGDDSPSVAKSKLKKVEREQLVTESARKEARGRSTTSWAQEGLDD